MRTNSGGRKAHAPPAIVRLSPPDSDLGVVKKSMKRAHGAIVEAGFAQQRRLNGACEGRAGALIWRAD